MQPIQDYQCPMFNLNFRNENMSMKIAQCLIICYFTITGAFAQKKNSSLYWNTEVGYNTATFQQLPSIDPSNVVTGYAFSYSCISDEKNGSLLFYSNGGRVFLPGHKLMTNGILTDDIAGNVLIVPDPSSSNLFYVFYQTNSGIYYAKVDLSNGGRVVSKDHFVITGVTVTDNLLVVSYLHKKGWWLIIRSRTGNTYYSFLITTGGVSKTPVISKAGVEVGNADGCHIFGSSQWGKGFATLREMNYAQGSGREGVVELFKIDKKCGTVSFDQQLYTDTVAIMPLASLAYSPDDSKIYLHHNGRIIQYSGSGYSDSVTIAKTFGYGLFTGDDDYIYFGQESPWGLDKIKNPDAPYPGCVYQKFFTSSNSGNPLSFGSPPRQINDRSYYTLGDKIDFTFDYACTRFQAEFKIINDSIYDSIVWYFGDPASAAANTSRLKNPTHAFAKSADYTVSAIGYICGFADTTSKVLKVRDRLNPRLGNDTTICSYDSLILNAKLAGINFYMLWPDGSTGASFVARDPGTYWVQVTVGDCKNTDSITVSKYADVWTALGDEYYICTDASEVVKLDAGEGFQNYKWFPTGDTTQWINVADLGDYLVIVKDFRGCRGDDGSKVKRSCPVKMFFPNVFTPNNDGLNDKYVPVGKDVTLFKMTIYNRWGEAVFESNDVTKTWDGMYKGKMCAAGVYLYVAHYEGYIHKQLMSFDTKGNITLLR
jgi:gliding motility-associated-like protein